jgi:hypothetical protein
MLSGTSPFKDASEWLIFQRIIARDIRFPDYFSQEARDLVDRLLVSYFLGCTWLEGSCKHAVIVYVRFLLFLLNILIR